MVFFIQPSRSTDHFIIQLTSIYPEKTSAPLEWADHSPSPLLTELSCCQRLWSWQEMSSECAVRKVPRAFFHTTQTKFILAIKCLWGLVFDRRHAKKMRLFWSLSLLLSLTIYCWILKHFRNSLDLSFVMRFAQLFPGCIKQENLPLSASILILPGF